MTALALLSNILNRDVAVPQGTLLSDIDGWDSMKSVRLVLQVEERLGRELTEDEMEGIRTIDDVGFLLGSSVRRDVG